MVESAPFSDVKPLDQAVGMPLSPNNDGEPRVLFTHLFSAPLTNVDKPVEELSNQGERDTLIKTLSEAEKRVTFISEAANTQSFRRAVGSVAGGSGRDCRILHYTGHGEEGKLTFESRSGQLEYANEKDLLQMLKCHREYLFRNLGESVESPIPPHHSGLRLVFLSACHSESVANCFIAAGVGHVVSVKKGEKVIDQKAHEFAKSFYVALLRGDTVNQAFLIGGNSLVCSGCQEGEKFVLLPEGGSHDEQLFEKIKEGPFVDCAPLQSTTSIGLDDVTEHFLGRAVEVQQTFQHMVDGASCITIMGEAGIGKTQVCLKACAYAWERHIFSDIIFCRVDSSYGRGERGDARLWLENGFGLKSLPAHDDKVVDEIARHVNRHLSRKPLLVLDGCVEGLLIGDQRVWLYDFLQKLLRDVPQLRAVVTMKGTKSCPPARLTGEVVEVKGLKKISTAKLFVKCCARKLTVQELNPDGEGDLDADKLLEIFSRGKIVEALRGHPGCVKQLSTKVTDKNLFLDEKEVLKELIPKIMSEYMESLPPPPPSPNQSSTDALQHLWRQVATAAAAESHSGLGSWKGETAGDDSLPWGLLCWKGLAVDFRERVPGAKERPLTESDFDTFAQDADLWKGVTSPAVVAKTHMCPLSLAPIPHAHFKVFWGWLWDAIKVLFKTKMWKQRQVLKGFLLKEYVQRELETAAKGTFMIRLSTTHHKALAVHYAAGESRVSKVLVRVGDNGLHARNTRNEDRHYKNLHSLIQSIDRLRFLHPNTPKEDFLLSQGDVAAGRLGAVGTATSTRRGGADSLHPGAARATLASSVGPLRHPDPLRTGNFNSSPCSLHVPIIEEDHHRPGGESGRRQESHRRHRSGGGSMGRQCPGSF